jgi:hypothetical protein
MMDTQTRETVIKLKLIGTLKIGDKISTRYQQIQPDSMSTKFSRYLYGESRLHTVLFIRNTIQHINQIFPSIQDPNIKKIISEDLLKAKLGLTALQETYAGDVRVVAELEELVQSIK